MRRKIFFAFTVITSVFILWSGNAVHAAELKRDAGAEKKLEIIRKNLSGLTEMKYADAKKYYEEALSELSALIGKYDGTQEALEAKFFMGAAHNEMHNFDEAIKCFDDVLGHGTMEKNFKSRTLYFKTKALLGKGDIATAKEVAAELRIIEPRAAATFTNELGGMLRVGLDAPTFNVADINGNPVDLSKYKGNITIMHFWATWSEPCIQEFPNVKKMYAKFKDKGVQFLGVSLDDDIEDLRGFVKHFDANWPQIYDGKRWAGEIPSLYHVQATPTMFLLDRENKIRYIGSETESITRIVTTLLSESKDTPLFR